MCQNLFSDKAPYGSILVSDQLPQATTKSSLHFGWSLTGGLTVLYLQ